MSVAINNERDFTWVETDEPHFSRRKEILSKHPEIANLFGNDTTTFWVVLAVVSVQVMMAYLFRNASWGVLLLGAYVISGTFNHTLSLAVHDLSHNLCFKSHKANKCLAIFANFATGFPSGMTFFRYHVEHHQYQGVDGVDVDVPTMAEVRIFNSTLRKVVWLFLQPAFYSIRPILVKPKPSTRWEVLNRIAQFCFNSAIWYFFGFRSLAYLMLGTLLGMGLHPCAGHFVAEHYELTKGIETYSYYGIVNIPNLNVGYHNEHHDFPKVPWTKLPQVKAMAPEYYDNLPCYTSYLAVFWRYITDPEVGPMSRVKRRRQLTNKKK